MEVTGEKGLVALLPFWSTPDGHGVAHASINLSSHL